MASSGPLISPLWGCCTVEPLELCRACRRCSVNISGYYLFNSPRVASTLSHTQLSSPSFKH